MTTPVPVPTTVNNFAALAMRTASNVAGTFNVNPDYLHAAMGVAEEHREMLTKTDVINQCEELVDIAWFVALGLSTMAPESVLFNVFDRKQRLRWSENPTLVEFADYDLAQSIDAYASSAKRLFAYGQARKGHFGRDEVAEFAHLDAIMRNVIRDFDEIEELYPDLLNQPVNEEPKRFYEAFLDRVIQKLRVRYPDAFNVDDATDRDLEAERVALEGGAA